ncbi:MAG: DUF484 family protein [Gammaproteobacteria bacterium]
MTQEGRLTPEIVAEYLVDNPDFLLEHPKVLTQLQLPHESGNAVSLIERQVDQLRGQNRKLGKQLNQLIRVATDNEALMHRLHDLTLELMLIDDLGAFFDRLTEVLMEEFEADILNITLVEREVACDAATPLHTVDREDAELKQFAAHLEKGETVCGRLNRNKLDFLFRGRAQWVQSTALVPLGDAGLMAIGSSDPARFYPGMGTLFLDLLARVITRRLALEEPEQQRRSA